jgi:hypothetical protein
LRASHAGRHQTSSRSRFGGLSRTSLASAPSRLVVALPPEFRAVVVMACDDEVIPFQERIEAVGDDADLQKVYDTDRHLLYVACTRGRDNLLVTSVEPASELVDNLRQNRAG